MTAAQFSTLFDWDTVQSADATEWCPMAPFQNIFVCGTYQIEKEDGGASEVTSPRMSRHGRIYVFEIKDTLSLEPHQVIDLPAVLDIKWCQVPVSGKPLLGAVTATAELLVFELQEDKKLTQVAQIQIKASDNSKEVLALSLDWSCARHKIYQSEASEVSIVVSDSHGGANLFKLSDDQHLSLIKRWQGHEYEAWIGAFYYWETSVFFTGGDDCVMNGWDTRVGHDSPVLVNRSHNAGVTSLQSNALHEYLIASGSYDEQLRIWDFRKMKHPLHTSNMSGGLWRVKWNPHHFDSILTACMHGGFHVVDSRDALHSSKEPVILASYTNHNSIAYGADWSHLDSNSVKMLCTENESLSICREEAIEELALVSTCSFYDHKLCVSLFGSIVI